MGSIFPIDVNGKNTSLVWRFGRTLTGGSSPSAQKENRLWPCPRCVSLPSNVSPTSISARCRGYGRKRLRQQLREADQGQGNTSKTKKHMSSRLERAHRLPTRPVLRVQRRRLGHPLGHLLGHLVDTYFRQVKSSVFADLDFSLLFCGKVAFDLFRFVGLTVCDCRT